MFSVSDIKETVYPAAYRRGKELYETAGVFDFSYELYLVDELPVADVRAKVRGINQEYYEVTATIDEEFGDVTADVRLFIIMRECASIVWQCF